MIKALFKGSRMRLLPNLLAMIMAVVLVLAVGASAAAVEGPRWDVSLNTAPSSLTPGSEGQVVLLATNMGGSPVTVVAPGTPVVVNVHLPSSLTAIGVIGTPQVGYENRTNDEAERNKLTCSVISGSLVTCIWAGEFNLPTYETIELRLKVQVAPQPIAGEEDEVTIEGGEAPYSQTRDLLTFSGAPTHFGVEKYELTPENENGSLDSQAGSHPFQMTTTIAFNSILAVAPTTRLGILPAAAAPARDLHFKLPPGLIGNPQPFPQCTEQEFETEGFAGRNFCPPETAVGVASVTDSDPGTTGMFTIPVPLFNLKPEVGEPARFGFRIKRVPIILTTSVRTGKDYGVTVSVDNLNNLTSYLSSRVTFWGVPGDPVHNAYRGWDCLRIDHLSGKPCASTEEQQEPLLTLPTSCTGPMETSVEASSWSTISDPEGEVLPPIDAAPAMESLDGCNRLGFEPDIKVAPDVESASSPSGLTVDVHVPQEESLVPTGLSEADVKNTTVTLPEGISLNPAGAGELEACSESQIGFLGSSSGVAQFSSTLPGSFCPNASKIATAKITTPLLPNPLEGSVYLAAQNANPFGSLVAMYLVVQDPVSGVLVNLPGEVSLNQGTGQVTATFANNPPLPFENAELHFFGGSRAPLSTPSHCGTYTTQASFTPWSGNAPVSSSSSFQITSGPNGGPCPGTLPFAPSLAAGSTNIQAGAFTPLSTTITREDGQQNIRSVSLKLPPGFSAMISSITPCPEAQANAGTCGPESLIGHTIVSVGLGGEPYSVTGGQVFITGPYEGAPFGLSIVNPAVAGPFNLGKVIVRAKLEIDKTTAQAIVTTDSSGPYAIPQILDGIPLQIKHVNVTIDRPGFAFNPTNCSPLSLSGSIASAEGASAPVSAPFQVTNCASMKFKPKFNVSTSAHTSKALGASLNVKLSYPPGSMGTQANVKSVKVELPKALPSQLKTLQKACTAKQFETNPAGCPAESVIGHAVVHTQLLPVPLEGPAYFVSHGGEAFPNLILVLQGYGVTVELVGDTDIKNGITSSTFASTPDVPFETFELNLPQGKYSALAANGNLCQQKLVMPTAFVAQNGATLNQETHIEVEGCSNTLSLVSKKLKKRTLKLTVYAPEGGKVTASGKGVSKGSKTYSGRENQTITVTQKHGGKLKTKIKLKYTSKKGKHQSKTVTVTFKK